MSMSDGSQVHHDGRVTNGAVGVHAIVLEGGLRCWPWCDITVPGVDVSSGSDSGAS